MKKLVRSFVLSIFSLLAFPAVASPITTVTLTADGGGLIATSAWDTSSTTLISSVQQLGSGLWQYDYTFSVLAKDLSNWIVQVSDSFTSANIFAGTTAGWELGWFGNQGNSAPGIPSLIYGLKFEGVGLDNYFRIVSDRSPQTSNAYLKDGRDGGADVYAYTSAWNTPAELWTGGPVTFGKILAPNTVTSVPEPSVLILMSGGLLGLVGLTRRRREKISSPQLR